jgi:hypothetical protein
MSLLLGPGATTAGLDLVNLGTDWSDGERLFAYSSHNAAGKKLELLDGTAAKPDETNEPTAVFSRVLKTPEALFSGDGGGNLAAVRAHTTAVLGSEGQAIGMAGSAITFSKHEGAHSLADAIGGYFIGVAKGESTRTGCGLFVNGRMESPAGWATGMEICADNETEEDHTFNGSEYPRSKAIHVHGAGKKRIAVGLFFGDVGSGVHTAIGAMAASPISNAFIRDDSEAPYSIRVKGAHATAAMAVAAGAGGVVIGAETITSAGCLLEVNGGAAKKDPLYYFRNTGENGMRGHLAGNSVTQLSAFVAGGTNEFATGAAKNDIGFLFLAGKNFFLGPTGGKAAVLRAAEGKLAFFGTAPVARPNIKPAAEATTQEVAEALYALGLVE